MVEFVAKVRISMSNGVVVAATIHMETGEEHKTLEDFKKSARVTELGYLQAVSTTAFLEYSNCLVNGKAVGRIIIVPTQIATMEIDIITPEEIKNACN